MLGLLPRLQNNVYTGEMLAVPQHCVGHLGMVGLALMDILGRFVAKIVAWS
jgi:hypothetical protein